MTGAAPPLSIGMPVYNGVRWMPRSLDSLLGQSFGDFELIISDNASTDHTEQLCRDFAARDRRIRYFRQSANIGIYPNYNAVFVPARGALFKWASSNDLCDREFLAKCVAVLAKRPDVVLCYPRTRLIDGDDRKVMDYEEKLDLQNESPAARGEAMLNNMRLNNAFNGVIRSAAVAHAMPMGSYYYSDVNLMLSLVLQGKFYEVPEYLFLRRVDKDACVALQIQDAAAERQTKREGHNPYGGRLLFLKYCAGFLRSVTRAPISMADRLRLYGVLARRIRWSQHQWFGQMSRDLAAVLGRR